MTSQEKWAEDAYCKNEIIRHRVKAIIAQEKTLFQKIEIFDLYDYGLSLFIDGIPQSAVKDEWVYHECLVHPAMLLNQNREDFHVLVLGTGEGASLRELLKYDFIKSVDAVDVDQRAVEIYQQHLVVIHQNSYNHEKVNLFFENAGDFLKRKGCLYDVIIFDITDVGFFNLGATESRKQVNFYNLIQSRLKKDGILAMHSSELTEIHHHKHLALKELVQTVFTEVFSYRTYVPFFECVWGFLLASNNQDLNPVEKSEEQFRKLINPKMNLKFINPRNLRSIFSQQTFYKV